MSLNKFTDTSIKTWMNIGADEIKCNSLDAGTVAFTNLAVDSLTVGQIGYLDTISDTRKKTMLGIPSDVKNIYPYIHPYYFFNNTESATINCTNSTSTLLFNSTLVGFPDSSSVLKLADTNAYDFEINLNCIDGTGYSGQIIYTLFLGGTALADVSIPSVNNNSPVKLKARLSFFGTGTSTPGTVIQNYEVNYQADVTDVYSTKIQNNRTTSVDMENTLQQLTLAFRLTTASTVPFNRQSVSISTVYSGVSA
jgi:hypothetical protein